MTSHCELMDQEEAEKRLQQGKRHGRDPRPVEPLQKKRKVASPPKAHEGGVNSPDVGQAPMPESPAEIPEAAHLPKAAESIDDHEKPEAAHVPKAAESLADLKPEAAAPEALESVASQKREAAPEALESVASQKREAAVPEALESLADPQKPDTTVAPKETLDTRTVKGPPTTKSHGDAQPEPAREIRAAKRAREEVKARDALRLLLKAPAMDDCRPPPAYPLNVDTFAKLSLGSRSSS